LSTKSKLLEFIDKNRYEILKRIILSVKPKSISETSYSLYNSLDISCLSTMIILLILERSKGNLQRVLEDLYNNEVTTSKPYISNMR